MLGASHVSLQLQFFDRLLNRSASYVTFLWSRFLALGAQGLWKPVDAGLAVNLVAVGAHLDNAFDQCEADLAAAFRVVFNHCLCLIYCFLTFAGL